MRALLRGMAVVCLVLSGCPADDMAGTVPSNGRLLDDPGDLEDAGTDAGTFSTDDLPEGEHCAPVARWDAQWAQFEEEVVVEMNLARSMAQDCRSEGKFDA